MNAVLKKRLRVESNLQKYYQQLKDLQETCDHTNIQKQHRASTGNYDPSADCYWTEFTCLDCNKKWTEEGSR